MIHILQNLLLHNCKQVLILVSRFEFPIDFSLPLILGASYISLVVEVV